MPEPSDFIGYIGDAALHDGRVLAVRQGSASSADVEVEGSDGHHYLVHFGEVESIHAHESLGMLLYALVEYAATSPARLFEFVNWDEDDDAYLRVIARTWDCSRID